MRSKPDCIMFFVIVCFIWKVLFEDQLYSNLLKVHLLFLHRDSSSSFFKLCKTHFHSHLDSVYLITKSYNGLVTVYGMFKNVFSTPRSNHAGNIS